MISKKAEWETIRSQLVGQLSDEEQRIVDALADGKTMPEVAQMLGQHRSMIWRKSQRIRSRITSGQQ